MKRLKIVINAIQCRSAGGLSVALNLLTAFKIDNIKHQLIVFSPKGLGYESLKSKNIEIITIPSFLLNPILRFLVEYFWIPAKIKRLKSKIIFNLGNFALPIHLKQLVLFHWPYAIYPEYKLNLKNASIFALLNRKIRLLIFKKRLHFATAIAVQTNTSKKRLLGYHEYNGKIEVIPSAVSLPETMEGGTADQFNFKSAASNNLIILLCLSKYYTHKNLEVFIKLAKIIRKNESNFKIIITISSQQDPRAKRLIDAIEKENLTSIIHNIGPVKIEQVPKLYENSDGMILPTLLESYSQTYIEAMNFNKPIFTSNLDFAMDVCGDCAFYFDPFDAQDIYTKIVTAYARPELIKDKVRKGKERVMQFPDWHQVSQMYIDLLEKVATS